MIKIKHIICLSLFGLMVSSGYAQESNFSQYHLSPVFTSPGEIGTTDYIQVLSHYRKQSIASDLGYRTFALSGIYPLYYKEQERRFGAIGLGLKSEASGSMGLLNTTSLQASYAYNWQFGHQSFISTGLQFGYHRRKFDITKVSTDSQFQNGGYDSGNSLGENFSDDVSKAFMADIGLSWYSLDATGEQRFTLGAAAFNLNKADFQHLYSLEDEPQPLRFTTYGSFILFKQENIHVTPTFRWLHENGRSKVNTGAQVNYQLQKKEGLSMRDSHLGFGLWYSSNNTAVIGMEMVQPNYVLALSYDLPTGTAIDYSQVNNAVELTFGWRLNKNKTRSRKSSATGHEEDAELPLQAMQKKSPEEQPIAEVKKEIPKALKQEEEEAEPGKEEQKEVATVDLTEEIINGDSSVQDQHIASLDTEKKKGLSPEEERILQENVGYELGSTALSPEAKKHIEEVATILKAHPELRIKVTGHTCNLGTERVNKNLSLKRAQVAKEAIAKKGIDPERIEVEEKSYLEPLESNETEEGRQKNRRVEFEVIE